MPGRNLNSIERARVQDHLEIIISIAKGRAPDWFMDRLHKLRAFVRDGDHTRARKPHEAEAA